MRLVLPSASNSHKDAAKDNPVSPGLQLLYILKVVLHFIMICVI